MEEEMEEWPMHTVTCITEGCDNRDIELEMPDNGFPTFCGVCRLEIMPL